IPVGARVAFVGASGSGKSTVVKMLMRMDDPAAGRVDFDGVSLRRYTLGSLRHRLGIVLQDTLVIAGTIADNIRIGRPDASDAEVRMPASAAGLDAQVSLLPDGYATRLTEGGHNLSGGQRQRLGIPRALLRNPGILVLDDATSTADISGSRIEPRRLRMVPIFAGISPGTLAGIARSFQVAGAEAGAVLITEGDPADRFFILVRGRVEILKGGRAVAMLSDGDHFGEIALLDNTLRTATVRAATHCIYATLQRADLENLVRRLPVVREALRRVQA